MSSVPLRFIHAADCLLDSPLRETGPLPDALFDIVANATSTAFEQMISACIEHSVDFLLLTGNIFDEAEASLAARIALVSGCELLAEADIDVLVWPGSRDPRSAWEAIPDLPTNVVLLPDESGAHFEYVRNDRLFAEFLLRDRERHFVPTGADETFRIGLGHRRDELENEVHAPATSNECGIYLALADGGVRHTKRSQTVFAHHPGATQAATADQTGPHGCTLVEVAADGQTKASFLSTSVIRREQFAATIEQDTHREQLVDAMAAALGPRRAHPGERIWLCKWRIQGCGPLFEQLAEEDVRREVGEMLAARETVPDGPVLHHDFRLIPSAADLIPSDRQAHQYLRMLDEIALPNVAIDADSMDADTSLAAWDAIPAEWPIECSRLDPAVVQGHARRFGWKWFAENMQEDAAR